MFFGSQQAWLLKPCQSMAESVNKGNKNSVCISTSNIASFFPTIMDSFDGSSFLVPEMDTQTNLDTHISYVGIEVISRYQIHTGLWPVCLV